jgi:FAD/FMN-containing dehydrogenase
MIQVDNLAEELRKLIKGDVVSDHATLGKFSHDASLFELKPKLVVYPKDLEDLKVLINYVKHNKKDHPELSLTARSGGTDMSGGAINNSIIVSFERYFTNIGEVKNSQISAQPGVYYHDFEPITLKTQLLLPSYPASREICMIGGMVANNAGGEKSLVYGKTDRYVSNLEVVLNDGKIHSFTALNKQELEAKLIETGFEGNLYRKVYKLIKENHELINRQRPHVSKNSTGYNIWDVWDGKTFDMTKLFVGSQGTLGLISSVTFDLVEAKPLSGMLVAFLPSLKNLGRIINSLLPLKPTSLESFDDHTLVFAFRFFLGFRKTLGWRRFAILGLSFIPVLNKLLHYFPHLPKLILLIEFEGENQFEIDKKISMAERHLKSLHIETQEAKDKKHEEKFWTMRRESFNLLRKNVKRKHTAPFIDDLIVQPKHLPEFLPKLTEILEKYELLYTVAGHMGDGNFHIIPLMDLTNPAEREKIYPALSEVTQLVLKYNGSLSGEHNDGLIRGPMLGEMYSPEMLKVFRSIKQIFDPENIFNPNKKTDATLEFSKNHMRKSFKK